MKKALNAGKQTLLAVILLLTWGVAQGQQSEYTIKALYIEKFARFTTWPSTSDTLVVAVIGKSSFGKELDKMAEKLSTAKKVIAVSIKKIEELGNARCLFVSASEDPRLDKIVAALGNKPVLTIGETEKCVKMGVHFVFYVSGNGTLHFWVNPRTIRQSGLETDIYLMNYGKIIR